MKAIIVEHPHPACILNIADPARAYVPSHQTDVSKTWEQCRPIGDIRDDYDRVTADDWLEIGRFK